MSRATWKQNERRTAKKLGGLRVPVSGRARGSTPDIAHPWLAIEAKHRKTLPAWMEDAMQQAEASRRGSAQLAIVTLHQARRNSDKDYVVMRLPAFVEWLGRVPL